jgi:hypothetical protein
MYERLRAALEKAAKGRGEKTSLNSEIVRRLHDSFVNDVLNEAKWLLEEARRIRDETDKILPDIEKDLRAGLTVDDIFPRNALLGRKKR